jgi:hypothetical protein
MARQIPTCTTHSCSSFVVAPVAANRKVRRLPRIAPSSTDARLEGCPIFDYVNDPLFSPAAAAASHKPSRPHTRILHAAQYNYASLLLHTVRRCYATRRIKWLSLSLRAYTTTIINPKFLSTCQTNTETFQALTRGYSGGRGRPDRGNRHYIRGGPGGEEEAAAAASLSFPPEADIKKGLDTSQVIETIPKPPHPSAVEDVPIENVQYVASYNWVDTEGQPYDRSSRYECPPLLPS